MSDRITDEPARMRLVFTFMRRVLIAILSAVVLGSCDEVEGSKPVAVAGDPVFDALQVWRHGAPYLESLITEEGTSSKETWTGRIEPKDYLFLEYPLLRPPIQFSCAIVGWPFESGLEDSLESSDRIEQLHAVVMLMRIRAPASVPGQWQALQELNDVIQGPAKELVTELLAEFSRAPILRTLSPMPRDRHGEPADSFYWAVRAAGVCGYEEAIPWLRSLSRSEDLYVSLSAERSLEELSGSEAEEALEYCLLGWRYDAARRAGQALLKRDRSRLKRALIGADVPERDRYQQGLLLAECDAPEAVPILCESVPELSIIDRRMFEHIGRLAGPEHAAWLSQLVEQVRPDQMDMAAKAVEQFRSRHP